MIVSFCISRDAGKLSNCVKMNACVAEPTVCTKNSHFKRLFLENILREFLTKHCVNWLLLHRPLRFFRSKSSGVM